MTHLLLPLFRISRPHFSLQSFFLISSVLLREGSLPGKGFPVLFSGVTVTQPLFFYLYKTYSFPFFEHCSSFTSALSAPLPRFVDLIEDLVTRQEPTLLFCIPLAQTPPRFALSPPRLFFPFTLEQILCPSPSSRLCGISPIVSFFEFQQSFSHFMPSFF